MRSEDNRLAISLGLPDTKMCVAALREFAPFIALAEIRLDLMDSFDLRRLIEEAACPLIMTCRPEREGGRFVGTENERIAILKEAIDLGCAYLDVEFDSVSRLARHKRGRTKLIVSRHWPDSMPAQLWSVYSELREQADVVKLVGMARTLADVFPVLALLQRATSPVIALAMGDAGRLTRLLAPCFESCLLTYAAVDATLKTASGQFSLMEMVNQYHCENVSSRTSVHLRLCSNEASADAVTRQNSTGEAGQVLHLPLVVLPEEVGQVSQKLLTYLPLLKLEADPSLQPFM